MSIFHGRVDSLFRIEDRGQFYCVRFRSSFISPVCWFASLSHLRLVVLMSGLLHLSVDSARRIQATR